MTANEQFKVWFVNDEDALAACEVESFIKIKWHGYCENPATYELVGKLSGNTYYLCGFHKEAARDQGYLEESLTSAPING